ncbi:GAF domain-containing protein [Geodermatophilus telluris]|uniref:protein-serine/threonine phosphatase n=1 Tax=Geodermatophilus telluris TaxID=1190417 RepID=A0A1G6VAZ0_9ACTN|nr:GAF domain-containing SpoIIE family protein phosphatase [Geodermatophilus telluris]SDD50671.1 GAF domain-containing protein [Geodermatophilus telluris]
MTSTDGPPADDPTIADADFDGLVALVRTLLDVPTALVTLVGPDEQVFPGAVGLPAPWQARRRTPLSHSFCQYVRQSAQPLVVGDARRVEVLADNGAVADLGVVAYCGVPLLAPDGEVVGAVCAIDGRPREWTETDVALLTQVAGLAASELRLRVATRDAEAARRAAEQAGEQNRLLLRFAEALADAVTLPDVAAAVSSAATEVLGTAWSYVGLVDPRTRRLRLVPVAGRPGDGDRDGHRDGDRDGDGEWPSLPLGTDHPPTAALARGRALFLPDAATTLARFPAAGSVTDGPVRFEASAHLPLPVAGDLPGTLSLVWDGPRTPTPAEEGLVLALARYTAQAVSRAVLLAEQESVATTLQRALLGELPAPAGLELAARYLPSSAGAQVGGDWWDAFEDSDGAPVLVIGDVTGHDVRAAATMGQLRSMLRGFAFEAGEPPAHALGRLDAAVGGLRVGALATAVVARVDPGDDGGRVLSWSNAGHPPPLLRSPDGTVEVLTSPPDLLVGLDPARARSTWRTPLPPGSTLLLYTDGLVERRRTDLDSGIAQLAGALAGDDRGSLDDLLDRLLAGVRGSTDDDVALLALRVTPAS